MKTCSSLETKRKGFELAVVVPRPEREHGGVATRADWADLWVQGWWRSNS